MKKLWFKLAEIEMYCSLDLNLDLDFIDQKFPRTKSSKNKSIKDMI